MLRPAGTDDVVGALRAVLTADRGERQRFSPVDAPAMLSAARVHGVVPVLYEGVAALDLDPDTTRSLMVLVLRQRRQIDRSLSDLDTMFSALATVGVRGLVLKGIPLAVRTGGSPYSRSVGDIDVLIDAGDLGSAHEALTGNGWRRKTSRVSGLDGAYRRWVRFVDHHEVFVGSQRTVVEVHWRLNQTLATAESFDAIMRRSVEADVAGRPVPVLPAAEDFALVATHAARHVFTHLKWVVDVARYWETLDDTDRWAALSVAEEWNSGRAFRLALAVVDDLGMLDGSDAARDAAASMIDRHARVLAARILSTPAGHRSARLHGLRSRAALQETWPDRGRLIGEIVLPTDVLADPRVPAPLSLLATPLRPLWRWRSS